ncbi:MAG TPA: hypothetical protein VGS41_17300 [Chthonomonadales bacterium]|nr:hypothetical protein [Chthonomonadales bacterium]
MKSSVSELGAQVLRELLPGQVLRRIGAWSSREAIHKPGLSRRAAVGFVALAVALAAAGCGPLDFTGGSFPPGNSFVPGRVVHIEGYVVNGSSQSPVPYSNVTLNIQYPGRAAKAITTLETTASASGAFDFPIQAGGTLNLLVQIVATPVSSSLQQQSFTFAFTTDRSADLIVSLAPSNIALPVAQVSLTGETAAVPANSSVQIHAALVDSTGSSLPVKPSLLYLGDSGVLAPGEVFYATAAGAGTITAVWPGVAPVTSGLTVSAAGAKRIGD